MRIPGEAKIDRTLDANVHPCEKYLTQLHRSQLVENDLSGKGCTGPQGRYQEQDVGSSVTPTAFREFRWGAKFNKDAVYLADRQPHTSYAAKAEIKSGAAAARVISSAVPRSDWSSRRALEALQLLADFFLRFRDG